MQRSLRPSKPCEAEAVGESAPAAGARGAQAADVTTVQRVDSLVTPSFTADETFFETLFNGSPMSFADIRAKAEKGEPLAPKRR